MSTVTVKETGRSYTWSRESADSKHWRVKSPNSHHYSTRNAEHEIGEDGVHIVRFPEWNGSYRGKPTAYLPDGSKTEATIDESGKIIARLAEEPRAIRRGWMFSKRRK